MQTRPAFSLLVFALFGCVGDNEVTMAGGGDGGGSIDDAMDFDETEGEPDDGSDEGDDPPEYGGGEGGGGEDPEDDPAGSLCGNAELDALEQCDDGNTVSGDGCEASCIVTIGVSEFALGGAHTCVVDYFGEVRCWGSNAYGQLGYGTDGLEEVGMSMTPSVFHRVVPIGQPVEAITAGMDHTCALTAGGVIFCWGRNDEGQLGYGHDEHMGDDAGETPLSYGPIPFGASALSIAAGRGHTCALLEDGDLRCWGDGSRGQIGFGHNFTGDVGAGDLPYRHAAEGPSIDMLGVSTAAVESGVGDSACVLDSHAAIHCWGANEHGQLGIGTDEDMGTLMAAMQVPAIVDEYVRQISVGESHVCYVTDATDVQCFGRNHFGQLGYARVDAIGDDEEPLDGEVHLDGHGAREVAVGADFSCALLDDGTVRCWGAGVYGQLGTGFTVTLGDNENPADAPTFIPVPLTREATDIDAGAHHICARTTDAALRCWGRGADGRLGYGDEKDVGNHPEALPIEPVSIF